VPYAITIDHTTFEDKTVTLREILSCKQVRVPIEEVAGVLSGLCHGANLWEEVMTRYPAA